MDKGISPAAVLTAVVSIVALMLYPALRWLWSKTKARHGAGLPPPRLLGWAALSEDGQPRYSWVALGVAIADFVVCFLQPTLTTGSRAFLYGLAVALLGLFVWIQWSIRRNDPDARAKADNEETPLLGPKERTRRLIKNGRPTATSKRGSDIAEWWPVILTVTALLAVATPLVFLAIWWQLDPTWPPAAKVLLTAGTFTPIGYACIWAADWIVIQFTSQQLPITWVRWVLPTADDDPGINTDAWSEFVSYLFSGIMAVLGLLACLAWHSQSWEFQLILYRTQVVLLLTAFAIDYAYYRHGTHNPQDGNYWMPLSPTTVWHAGITAIAVFGSGVDALIYWVPRWWHDLFASAPVTTPAPSPSPGTGTGSGGSVLLGLAIIVAAILGWQWLKGRLKKGK